MPLRVRVSGDFPKLPLLAVVGSRRPTHAAVASIPWIVDSAVSSGWALLSGGARGVDGEVRRECLSRGGVTAVVPGSVGSPEWSGSNRLLRDGALLVAEPEDLVAALALLQPSAKADAKQDQEDARSRQEDG